MQYFSHCKSIGIFPNTQGQPTLQSGQMWPELMIMIFLVTDNNEKRVNQNAITRVETTLNIVLKVLKGS